MRQRWLTDEKEWVAGLFIACHIDNDIVEFIDSYQEPKNVDDLTLDLRLLCHSRVLQKRE